MFELPQQNTTNCMACLTEIYFVTVLKADIQDQGSSRTGFWCGLSSWLADVHLPLCPLMIFPLCMHRGRAKSSVPSSSYVVTSPIRLRPYTYVLI